MASPPESQRRASTQRIASFSMSKGSGLGSKSFDASALAALIEDKSFSDTEKTPYLETIRVKTKKYLAASFLGKVYTNTLLVLSILSCLQYIFQTYISGSEPDGRELLNIFSKLELCLAALFAFDWFLNLFVADHRWEQLVSFFSLVDFATVIPIWITYYCFDNSINVDEIRNGFDLLNYILHGAYTLRILRVLRVHKTLNLIEDEVHRYLWQLGLSVITMILFDAAIIQYLERNYFDAKFHTWMYYMVVTICTVGYGDISPQSNIGRLTVMGFICFAIIFVPKKTNELIEVVNRLSVWARASYRLRGNQKHVLICGELESTSLNQFFSELFHQDHENMNLNAVILLPDPPSNEMHAVLNDPLFSLVIHYLQGSPLNDSDLYRAKADQAIAIFLMGNKFSSNPDEEDAQTILRLFSIQRYTSATKLSDPLYCLQLIRPENRRHLTQQGLDYDKEVVVCLNELKMGVLAKTCAFPGTGTLIFNLLTSFADNDDDENLQSTRDNRDLDRSGSDQEEDEDDEDDDTGSWMSEYLKGCDWEIYTTELAEMFCGYKFSALALKLYARLGIVLFALRVRELKGKGTIRVLLNPADYVIPSNEKYFIEAFVIAKNKATSDLSLQGNQSASDGDALSSITSALSKTAEATTTAIRRQSMAIRFGHKVEPNDGSPNLKGTNSGWQSVLSKYETSETSHNQQEALQKQEDEELRKFYFVREVPLILSEATIHTSVMDHYPSISGHMIVIAKGLNSLYDLIRPLRAKYLGKLNHIVILYPHNIPLHIWRRISIFEGILVVKGSPLEESDLRRAGIFRAGQVVVLADSTSNGSMNALTDADVIFTYHSVKRLNEKTQILIEIVRHENVSYLDTSMSTNTHNCDFKFTPHFAAGTLFTSTILDSIVCQAFYNPQIIRVLDTLISGAENLADSKLGSGRGGGGGAAGGNANTTKRPKVGLQAVVSSALYQMKIPDNLDSRTYGALFKSLCQDGILPLGLLRGVFPNMSTGAKGNKMNYVYTNPHRDTELFTCDRVFVLSPKVLTGTKSSSKELLDKFLQYSCAGPLKEVKKIQEEVGNLEAIKEELRAISTCQSGVDKSLGSMVSSLEDKIYSILTTINEIELAQLSSNKRSTTMTLKSSQTLPGL